MQKHDLKLAEKQNNLSKKVNADLEKKEIPAKPGVQNPPTESEPKSKLSKN